MKNKILIPCVALFLLFVGIMSIGSDGFHKLWKRIIPARPDLSTIDTVPDYYKAKREFPRFKIDKIQSDTIDFLRLLISLSESSLNRAMGNTLTIG